jgi:hypothetical protein
MPHELLPADRARWNLGERLGVDLDLPILELARCDYITGMKITRYRANRVAVRTSNQVSRMSKNHGVPKRFDPPRAGMIASVFTAKSPSFPHAVEAMRRCRGRSLVYE